MSKNHLWLFGISDYLIILYHFYMVFSCMLIGWMVSFYFWSVYSTSPHKNNNFTIEVHTSVKIMNPQ